MSEKYADNPTAFVQWLREHEPKGGPSVIPKSLHEIFKEARAREVTRVNTALIKAAGLIVDPQSPTGQTS